MAVPAGDNLKIEIVDINMYKITTSGPREKVSLFGQFVELTFYQSVFEPLISAKLLIHDTVGLQNGYPLTGEEYIKIDLKQDYPEGFVDNSIANLYKNTFSLYFCVENISDIVIADNAKDSFLVMNLISVESIANEMHHISKVNKDQKMLEEFADKLFEEYVYKDLKKIIGSDYDAKINGHKKFASNDTFLDPSFYSGVNTNRYIKYETSIAERPNMIIPHMRPFEAIKFLAKHSVGKDAKTATNNIGNYTYVFFETLRGFYFVTLEKLMGRGRFGERDSSGAIKNRTYYYIPDKALISNMTESKGDNFFNTRIINNFYINSKYSSQDKIVGGYVQNRLVEVNIAQQSYTKFDNSTAQTDKRMLGKNIFNTENFLTARKTSPGTTDDLARTRYTINNFKNDLIPEIRHKWGKTVISTHALNQIDVSISIPPDINLTAGDIVVLKIPEFSAFTDQPRWDEYMSGHYIATEVKQTILKDGTSTTSLRLQKDGVNGNVQKTSEIAVRNG